MRCAKCRKTFLTIDFYDHIFVKEECKFSDNDKPPHPLTAAEIKEDEEAEQEWLNE